MTESARALPQGTNTRIVCVIGSGPAGMTVALKLAKLGHRVVVVESGGVQHDEAVARLSHATLACTSSHAPMEDAVVRQWGGTSRTWGGRCVPYDAIDFTARPDAGVVGWPLSHRELDPYWDEACLLADCGAPAFTVNDIGHKLPLSQKFQDGEVRTDRLERWSASPEWASTHGLVLENHPNVQVKMGLTVVGFRSNTETGTVNSVTLVDVSKPAKISEELDADYFVVACGGVETTRLLLNAIVEGQVNVEGREHLGRYYMGHPSGKIAQIALEGDPSMTEFGFLRHGEHFVRRRLSFEADSLISNSLLNIVFWLDNPPPSNARHGSGILSSAYLAMLVPFIGKRLAPEAIRKSLTRSPVTLASLMAHLRNVLLQFPSSLMFSASFLWKRYFAKPRLPGFFVYSPENRYALHYHAEQSANPDSTIELSNERDDSGLRRAVINLQFSRRDAESIVKAHALLDEHLRKYGIGALEYQFAKDQLVDAVMDQASDGFHQIGSARMGHSPQDGVTDGFGRVFGTSNLYLCSSAVFPTSGQANPTLTLLAFALRQADHISSALKS